MSEKSTELVTPIGKLLLVADPEGLREIRFESNPSFDRTDARVDGEDDPTLREARAQLAAYFSGKRRRFDLPLKPKGTEFQRRVWAALQKIPYGQTASYGEIARQIGQPRASRAVGAANGRNPLPIVIACHRVIGTNGRLTGYGGGLPIKEYLLALERGERPHPI